MRTDQTCRHQVIYASIHIQVNIPVIVHINFSTSDDYKMLSVLLRSLFLKELCNDTKTSENDQWENWRWGYKNTPGWCGITSPMYSELPHELLLDVEPMRPEERQTHEHHVLQMFVLGNICTYTNAVYWCPYCGSSHWWLQESRQLGLLPCFTLGNCASDGNLKRRGIWLKEF